LRHDLFLHHTFLDMPARLLPVDLGIVRLRRARLNERRGLARKAEAASIEAVTAESMRRFMVNAPWLSIGKEITGPA